MNAETRSLIEALHRSGVKAALVFTGGGAGAAAQLLAVPGGSRTILEATVPYHEHALCEYLGFRPDQFCSGETAVAMAERALERARGLSPSEPLAGLAVTASLVTDRPKKGDHRFHVAVAREGTTRVHSVTLEKDARDREAEEAVVDAVALNLLAEALGVAERMAVPFLPAEKLETETLVCANHLAELLSGHQSCVCVETDGRMRIDGPKPGLLVPGAFNPLHEGHRRLMEVAEKLTGLPAAFELSIVNVDKPPLGFEEVRRRLRQFQWLAPAWLTRAATFAEKASLFPGVVFVVGVDTAARIVDARYYDGDAGRLGQALEHLRSQGCRFLVAGRRDPLGRFQQLADLPIETAWQELFSPIPEEGFHLDLSSTELRQQKGAKP